MVNNCELIIVIGVRYIIHLDFFVTMPIRHSRDYRSLGLLTNIVLDEELREALYCRFQRNVNTGTSFSRAVVHGVTYHSQAYQRIKRRNSYTVAYSDGGVVKLGFIRCFLSISTVTVAIISPLTPSNSHCYPDQLHSDQPKLKERCIVA